MCEWEYLPQEVLCNIFSFLSRRDRLSCALVCQAWQDGLNDSRLWEKMTVHVDVDLMEPSTTLLMRNYSKYLEELEFGWAYPSNRWSPYRHKQLTKRAVRFFSVLHDSSVQIRVLKIFNWFNLDAFKKVTYHFSRLLGIQKNLWKITMETTNMHSFNYMKILASCLGCSEKVTYLDVESCYYCQEPVPVYFRSCIEQLRNLRTLKLDYYLLSCKVIGSIMISKNTSLENLEVTVKDNTDKHIIDREEWTELRKTCPKLKVTFIFKNLVRFEDLQVFLQPKMPLVGVCLDITKAVDEIVKHNFDRTLLRLSLRYKQSLEHVNIRMRSKTENVDEILYYIICDFCPQLNHFMYTGLTKSHHLTIATYKRGGQLYCASLTNSSVDRTFSPIVNLATYQTINSPLHFTNRTHHTSYSPAIPTARSG